MLTLSECILGLCEFVPLGAIVGQMIRRATMKKENVKLASHVCLGLIWLSTVSCLSRGIDSNLWIAFREWFYGAVGMNIEANNIECATWFPLLCFRLFLLCLGILVGQAFAPFALTGSIATGKSTVGEILIDTKPHHWRPFRIIDTDKIGHDVLLPSVKIIEASRSGQSLSVSPKDSVYDSVLRAFGDSACSNRNVLDEDGLIDRRKLGDIIFREKDKRRTLNRITHPRIIRTMLRQIVMGIFSKTSAIMCADIPLLFESGLLRSIFTITIVVACDPKLQFERLRERNPDLSEQQCKNRIESQLPIQQKVEQADIAIWNNSDLECLALEVERARSKIFLWLKTGERMLLYWVIAFVGSLVLTSVPIYK